MHVCRKIHTAGQICVFFATKALIPCTHTPNRGTLHIALRYIMLAFVVGIW